MATDAGDELKAIRTRLFKVQLVGIFGTALLGLGLYGLFGEEGNRPHSLFGNRELVRGILLLGVAVILWQFSQIAALQKKRIELIRKNRETPPS